MYSPMDLGSISFVKLTGFRKSAPQSHNGHDELLATT